MTGKAAPMPNTKSLTRIAKNVFNSRTLPAFEEFELIVTIGISRRAFIKRRIGAPATAGVLAGSTIALIAAAVTSSRSMRASH